MPNYERLEKLAAHMESGKLGHQVFSISCINEGDIDPITGCGTVGCMLGELPIVFPEDWQFFYTTPTTRPGLGAYSAARHYFEISDNEAALLFSPARTPWGTDLDTNASRYEAADSVRKFIVWKKLGGFKA